MARADPELSAGSTAHYTDPAYYTQTYRKRVEDVRFYVDLVDHTRGPVLEIGCGNGRITLPIARAGHRVTGVDLSPTMLSDLRTRLADEEESVRARVRLHRADMRRFRVDGSFRIAICPFNTFLHLYTRSDVERFLSRVKAHLGKRGELVIDISIPEPEELLRKPSRAYFAPRFRYPGEARAPSQDATPAEAAGGKRIRYSERFEYDKLRQVLFVAMEFEPEGGGEPWMTPLAHRQFYPEEIRTLLHYNGFRITAEHGDFFGNAPTSSSDVLILRCRPR